METQVEKSPAAHSSASPRRSLHRRLLRLALFTGVQLLIVVVLLEIVLRFTDPGGISYYPETASYLDTLVREADGYRNQAGLHGRFYGADVSINSLGIRDREVPETKAPGEFRVMVMGDSVPFGIGVSLEQSIPGQIEAIANQRARGAGGQATFRTLNLGVPSYNTEQELTQFRALAPRLQPDLVVLIYCLNDIKPKMWVFEKRASRIADLAQRSYAASALFVTWRNMKMKGASAADVLGITGYERDNPQWQAVDRGLTQLNTECKSRKIPLAVFTRLDGNSAALELLKEVAAREGFALLPRQPVQDPRWDQMQKDLSYQNSKCDSHPNSAGCTVYGELMVNELSAAGLLPIPKPEKSGGPAAAP